MHWTIHCGVHNKLNKEETKKLYKELYSHLMQKAEQEKPDFYADINSAIELRQKLKNLAEHIKSNKSVKVTEKTKILREIVVEENGKFNLT